MSLPGAVRVGIDISKKTLDVAIGSNKDYSVFGNDSPGIDSILKVLDSYSVSLILMEVFDLVSNFLGALQYVVDTKVSDDGQTVPAVRLPISG